MSKYGFKAPLRLAGGTKVYTLAEAAEFARNYAEAKLPARRDAVVRELEAASGPHRERTAANSFRLWAQAEGLGPIYEDWFE
jgi:hypothetical protein